MDQFRGYTVAGMFVVNFVGGLAASPRSSSTTTIYFSYADTIMPSFMFAVGFSYRLAILRRLAQLGPMRPTPFVIRSLALVLVSLVMYAKEDFAASTGPTCWDRDLAGRSPEFSKRTSGRRWRSSG